MKYEERRASVRAEEDSVGDSQQNLRAEVHTHADVGSRQTSPVNLAIPSKSCIDIDFKVSKNCISCTF